MTGRDTLGVHPVDAAARILGGRITSTVSGRRVVLRITEVEAYGGVGEDPGSHAFRRLTPRNATMFGRAGLAYVYFTYGLHWCFCIVTGKAGEAAAVLVRAGEVIDGVDTARARRPGVRTDRDLARGPARLTRAMGLSGDHDGVDLLAASSEVRLHLPRAAPVDHRAGPRTGVSGAGAMIPWRFWLPGEPTVSPYRPAPRSAAP